jgi:hypothetical protein
MIFGHDDQHPPQPAHVGPLPAWVWVPLGLSILTVLALLFR